MFRPTLLGLLKSLRAVQRVIGVYDGYIESASSAFEHTVFSSHFLFSVSFLEVDFSSGLLTGVTTGELVDTVKGHRGANVCI